MMKRILAIIIVLFVPFLMSGCAEKQATEESFNISVYLPSTFSIEDGGSYTFNVLGKETIRTGDMMILKSLVDNDRNYSIPVSNVKEKSFDIVFPKGFVQGKYSFSISRGHLEVELGSAFISVTYNGSDADLDPATTVYGWVKCEGSPIEGAVISDGYEVVSTNKEGLYQMASQKKNPYVFISIPSGYTVASEGILPSFMVYLIKPAATAERVDFNLFREDGQQNHTMLFFGDIHLANRNKDRVQFSEFVSDVNSYVSSVSGPVYAMTLGDMTWDQYWYSNDYFFEQYLADAKKLNGVKVFHTIGNHDHDMNAVGDWDTVIKYKKAICPNYYSFNVGNVHYISIDDILCKNTQASMTNAAYRKYEEKVAPEVLDWLRKDLEYVSKSTRIVATSHAPVFNQNGAESLRNAKEFVECFSGYDVDFVTGHSHKLWNVDMIKDKKLYEHNSGAVCASWWWTGYYTPGLNIGQDGTPSGWRIFNVRGNDVDWQFKGTQRRLDYQMRAYDRNEISITASQFAPFADEAHANAFDDLVEACGWSGSSKDNYVYVNVWDYDPSWTVSVTEQETGKNLEVKRISGYDPLYLIAYSAMRYNVNKNPTFSPFRTNHIFMVQASSATSTLRITVKDRFGRTYDEVMSRPKEFSLSTYLKE
mgnify:FL=1